MSREAKEDRALASITGAGAGVGVGVGIGIGIGISAELVRQRWI